MPTIQVILKDKYTLVFFAVSLMFLAAAFSVAYINILDNQNLLVIHFDAYRGADYFGTSADIWDILIIAGVIWSINLLLTNELYFRERILSYILASSTLVFMVLILAAVKVIININ